MSRSTPAKTARRFFLMALTAQLSLATFAEVHGARWRWSNPLPHGNNVLDMLVATDVAVQVGDGGTLYVQRTDERWAPAVTGTTNYLRSVAMMGDRILASGENGCILWSDNGDAFQPAGFSQTTTDWFEGIAASSQRAVAVGDNGTIFTSTNGVYWTKASSGTTEWLRGVVFGAGAFVAVGENGKILRSTNGSSWSSKTSGTTAHLNRVRYLGSGGTGQYVAVGNGGVALASTDGNTWAPLNSGTTNNLYDAALNDTGMLLVGDQEIRFRATGDTAWTDQIVALPTNAPPAWVYLSAHGEAESWLVAGRTGLLIEGRSTNGGDYAWQPSPDSPHAWLWDVTVQNGIYVAVGDLANIQTSLDGILWASEVVSVPHTNTVLLGVGGTTNLLLAVGNDGIVLASRAGLAELSNTTHAVVDTYGVVWTNLPSFTTNTLQGIAAAEHLFIATGEAGSLFTSPDGTNWVERATPTTSFLSGVAIGPAACVAVGANGTLLRAAADGTGWTAVAMGTSDWLYRVRWIDGQFIVVGQNGKIYTSPDGAGWTARTSGTARWLTDAACVEGQWFVTGYQGTLLASTNLAEWTRLPLPTIKSLFAAATMQGQLVVAGIEGVILRNRVVPDATPVQFLAYNHTKAVDSGSATNAYELFLFGGSPDQFFEFQSSTNLTGGNWATLAELELFDSSGTIYLLRTRDATNTPPAEYYRAQLLP